MVPEIATVVALIVTALISMGATVVAVRWCGLWRR